MATTRTYRLKLIRDGAEFEAEGDKAFVLEMLLRFGPGAAPTARALTPPAGPSSQGSKPQGSKPPERVLAGAKETSIREFVQQLGLKRHTDITVAFGYYLEKFSGLQAFTPADINNCYYEAKLESSNTSQMIIQNIKRGLMMPSRKRGEKGKSRYTLTASGEAFVESKIGGKP